MQRCQIYIMSGIDQKILLFVPRLTYTVKWVVVVEREIVSRTK